MTFIGHTELVHHTVRQSEIFNDWIRQGRWHHFGPMEHFDWWAFPIDQDSHAYGDKYNITPSLEELRSDRQFLEAVLSNAASLMTAWGWDVTGNHLFADRYPNYGVRLWKCGHSLKILGMPAALSSLDCFARLRNEERSRAKWRLGSECVLNPLQIDLAPGNG